MASPSPSTMDKMLKGPALRPPQGTIPNLSGNYSSAQFTFYICVTLCTVASGILLLLRSYIKFAVSKKTHADDYFLILGFLLFIALIACGRVTLEYGVGVHQWNVTLGEFFDLLYWLNLFQVLYAPCCICIKTALVLQYLRMFVPLRSLNMFMFVGGWATIALNFGFYFSRMLVAIFSCTPREKIWNKLYVGGSCVDNNQLHLVTGYFNIVSDLIILLFPVRSLWKLHVPRRRKFGISLLFSSGLLATVGTAMRLYYGLRAIHTGDWTYNMAWDGLWAFAELALGIIVTCAMTLPKLLKEPGAPFAGYFSKVSSLWTTTSQKLFVRKGSSQQSTDGSSQEKEGTIVQVVSKESKSDAANEDAISINGCSNVIMSGEKWSETIDNLA